MSQAVVGRASLKMSLCKWFLLTHRQISSDALWLAWAQVPPLAAADSGAVARSCQCLQGVDDCTVRQGQAQSAVTEKAASQQRRGYTGRAVQKRDLCTVSLALCPRLPPPSMPRPLRPHFSQASQADSGSDQSRQSVRPIVDQSLACLGPCRSTRCSAWRSRPSAELRSAR